MIDLFRNARLQRTLSECVQSLLQLLHLGGSNDDRVSVLGSQYRVMRDPAICERCFGYPGFLGDFLPFRQCFPQARLVVKFVVQSSKPRVGVPASAAAFEAFRRLRQEAAGNGRVGVERDLKLSEQGEESLLVVP